MSDNPTDTEIAAHQKRMAELRREFGARWYAEWNRRAFDAHAYGNLVPFHELLWDAFRAGAEIGGKL